MRQRIKQLVLLSLVSLFRTFAFGQVRIGVSGGMNFSNVNFNQGFFDYRLVKTKIALGFHSGLLATIELHKKVYIQSQLLYSLQGWSLNHVVKGSRMSLHYINLPLLVGYKPFSKFSLHVGTQVGMLLKAHLQPESFLDYTKLYRRIDIGIALGANYHLTRAFGVEVKYIHGLTSLVEGTMTDATGTIKDGYNRNLQVGIFYLFGKKNDLN